MSRGWESSPDANQELRRPPDVPRTWSLQHFHCDVGRAAQARFVGQAQGPPCRWSIVLQMLGKMILGRKPNRVHKRNGQVEFPTHIPDDFHSRVSAGTMVRVVLRSIHVSASRTAP